jgi:hypothetical protein
MVSPQLNLTSKPTRQPMIQTVVHVGIHLFVWIGVLAVMAIRVPRSQERFADTKFHVNWITITILDVSNFIIDFWFISAPLIIVLLLAVDGPVYHLLRLHYPTRSWIWSAAMIILPLLTLSCILFALSLPFAKVHRNKSLILADDPKLQDEIEKGNRAILIERCAKYPEAVSNGDRILEILEFPPVDAPELVKPFIGQKVAFYGITQDSSNANLLIAEDVILDVEIIANWDPRPVATSWDATAMGTLKSVNIATKTVFIRCKREDWQVVQTW